MTSMAAAIHKALTAAPAAILTDMDDTLCFEAELLCALVNAQFGLALDATKLTDYHPFRLPKDKQNRFLHTWRHTASSYVNHAPDYEARAALRQLHAAGHTITVSSDRPTLALQPSLQWLQTWQYPYDHVVIAGDGAKQSVVARYGPANPLVVIDDDARSWRFAAPGIQVWTPKRPWTPPGNPPDGCHVFDSWDTLLASVT